MLVIHAPNVHQGGGRTLLLSLLEAVDKNQCRIIVDQRLGVPSQFGSIVAHCTEPSLRGRLIAEWRLRELAGRGDSVLCFSGLPPLFRSFARVALFVQNLYTLSPIDTSGFPFKVRVRIQVERVWLRLLHRRADKIIVQTDSVRRKVEQLLGRSAEVLPFAGESACDLRQVSQSRRSQQGKFDFIYVASGEPHKNHANLLNAWIMLARENCFPSLCLTVDEKHAPALAARIALMRVEFGLKVDNRTGYARGNIFDLYREANALIYPSLLESLGLPLIEAASIGLPILASELDYVRDVIDPAESFDPASSLSIARAVKRHLGIVDKPLMPNSAREWLDALIEDPR